MTRPVDVLAVMEREYGRATLSVPPQDATALEMSRARAAVADLIGAAAAAAGVLTVTARSSTVPVASGLALHKLNAALAACGVKP